MSFPLIAYEHITPLINLVFALLIGIGFGFVLERGGLGNAKKLIAQFLLKDLTVFKVMFTCIITAMTGLFFLSIFGMINMDLVSSPESYLLPQLVGGLLLGVGFVIAGYCPGTTIVGMASGKIDAIYSFIGLFVGAFVFSLVFQWIEPFYNSTRLETPSISQVLDLKQTSVITIAISLALIGFYVSEKLEFLNE